MNRSSLFSILLALFATLPAFGLAASEPPAATEVGVEGVISIFPARGGPTRQGEPDSRPLPAKAFVVMKDNEQVAAFETDKDGRFRVALPPGHYKVVAAERRSSVGFYGPFDFEVTPGHMTSVAWKCDSGMQ